MWRMSGPAARHVLDAADLTAGEDRLEADHHVLDAPVQGRELADRARRDQPAHLGDRLRLRRVPGREPLRAQRVLEHLQRYAALGGDHHVDGIDVEDRVHLRAVEHDGVLDDGLEPALRRGAAGAGHHVHEVLVGEREHLRHVLGGPGEDDGGRDRAVVDAVHGGVLLEAVDARLAQLLRVGDDLRLADETVQRGDDVGSAEVRS